MKLDPQKVLDLANQKYLQKRGLTSAQYNHVFPDHLQAIVEGICESINQMSLSSPSIEKPKMDMPCKHENIGWWPLESPRRWLFWCWHCGSISESTTGNPQTWTSPKP